MRDRFECDFAVVKIAGDRRTIRMHSMDVSNSLEHAKRWCCVERALRTRLGYLIPAQQLKRRIGSRIKTGRWQTIFVAGLHPAQVDEVTAIVHQELATYGITITKESIPDRWHRESNEEADRDCEGCRRPNAPKAR